MSRPIRLALTLGALVAMLAALATGAVAASHGPGKAKKPDNPAKSFKRLGVKKLTGGTTTLAITGALPAGLTIAPVLPAVQSDPSVAAFTLPITKGHVVVKRGKRATAPRGLAGWLRHDGGLTLSLAGKPDVTLTKLRIVLAAQKGGVVTARVSGKGTLRLFTLSGGKVENGVGTATMKLAKQGTKALNKAFGTSLVSGAEIGTLTVDPAGTISTP